VALNNGDVITVDASFAQVTDGALYLYDDFKCRIAGFSAGFWTHYILVMDHVKAY